MSEYSDLFSKIRSFENLDLAYHKARKGKRGKESVAAFEYDQEKELLRLRDDSGQISKRSGSWGRTPEPDHFL